MEDETLLTHCEAMATNPGHLSVWEQGHLGREALFMWHFYCFFLKCILSIGCTLCAFTSKNKKIKKWSQETSSEIPSVQSLFSAWVTCTSFACPRLSVYLNGNVVLGISMLSEMVRELWPDLTPTYLLFLVPFKVFCNRAKIGAWNAPSQIVQLRRPIATH